MVFSSTVFVFLFLPLTIGLYYIADRIGGIRLKNAVLLIASLVFYAWGGLRPLLLLLLLILINWCFALLMQKFERLRTVFLMLAIGADLLNLMYFKYFNFIMDNVGKAVNVVTGKGAGLQLKEVILPIGISFFTFQIMSYVIDVYRGTVPVQKNLLKLALYVMMFPQLIAGPIVRYRDVNLEIEERSSRLPEVERGIKRFIVGFAKKVFLANAMGNMADIAFDGYTGLNMVYAWLGAVCYAFQIFYDFSAYSDMAIGLGWIFGFHFNENFNYPYISQSIQEFWRRWHISLSSWFRDYVYIPLGGNRKGKVRTYGNLFTIFLLTGIWHGAAWQFIVWGIYHGIFSILERMGLGKILEKLPRAIRHIYAILVVIVGWVFFRADNLAHAAAYLGRMFSFRLGSFKNASVVLHLDAVFVVCFLISLLCVAPIGRRLESCRLMKCPNVSRVMYLLLWFVSVIYMVGLSYNPFIYFKF